MANIVFSEGSGLNNSVYGKCQEPIKMMIEKKAESFEAESILPEVFSMQTSKNYGEKITAMTGTDGFKPTGEGGNYPVDGMRESFSKFFEHVTWKDSFPITEEMIQDSKILDLKQKPQSFVTGFYRTREQFGAAVFGGAISGKKSIDFAGHKFDVTTADKKTLFALDHPSVEDSSKKQANMFSDAFSKSALGAMECAMQNFRGDKDEILAVSPTTIIIPNDYELKEQVFAAIGADKDPNTANNGFNYLFGRWRVIVWNYLNQFIGSDQKPWLLFDKRYNEENMGAVWFDREDLKIKSIIDENNDNNIWKGRARFTAGFNDWRAFAIGGVNGGKQLIGG